MKYGDALYPQEVDEDEPSGIFATPAGLDTMNAWPFPKQAEKIKEMSDVLRKMQEP